MYLFDAVFDNDHVKKYVHQRWLTKAYLKALSSIKDGWSNALDFKERKPKWSGIYQFRINQKYRWYALIKGDILYVIDIDDHQ